LNASSNTTHQKIANPFAKHKEDVNDVEEPIFFSASLKAAPKKSHGKGTRSQAPPVIKNLFDLEVPKV
jgi:hypothetical protein